MTAPLDVGGILADPKSRIVVCCGSGGVGKTTTAASMALRAAEQGRRVVVLTIDPARRLAQALGVEDLGNTPQPVQLGPGATGELHAMMLNMRRTFDDMVLEHSTPEKAQQILANPFYQTVATSFSGTQEYMAMEKLGQLAASDEWDLVVVDTPPSRNALDFLDAPQRLGAFLDGRMIRMLSAPGRRHRTPGDRRDGPGPQGREHRRRQPDARRRVRVRAVLRVHVRRVPGARRPDLRAAAGRRHPLHGGRRAGAGRVAGGVVLRRAADLRRDAAGRTGAQPHTPDAQRRCPPIARWRRRTS